MLVSLRHIAACVILFLLAPSAAFAECANCGRTPPAHQGCQSCNTSPPPCAYCAPPQIVVPRPQVSAQSFSGASASASAQASATSIAIASAQTGDVVVRNNASVGDLGVSAGVESYGFGELAVAAAANHAALVSAICVDAQGAVMPAAQTFAAREVAQTFQGEIFRCAAAVHMRVTMDQRSFDCALGEALWYANGQAACSAQIARDPSNERWLLRHYGAGEKVVRIRETTAILPAASHATQFGPLPGSGGVGY